MATAIFVVLLIVAIAAANALLWIPVVLWFRRRRTASLGVIADELLESGERMIRGPERTQCRGGTGDYAQVSGNGFLRLTDQRLIFLKLTGGRVDIKRSAIDAVAVEKHFLGKAHAGKQHLVVTTASGWQVGFVVADPTSWVESLRSENPADLRRTGHLPSAR